MKLKRSICAIALVCIMLASSFTVQAVNVIQVPDADVQTVYNQAVQSNRIQNWPKGPQIYSEAGIVMDMDSGAILYAKNIDNPHYPASITKILTALVALENSKMTDTVTVKREDVSFLTAGDNHIGLKVGEEISMKDALHGALLASGNEVAHAIGSSIDGGYESFLEKMNDKAKELGCTNSNFTNTHGLHESEHYTTVRDMALIGAAAFQNKDFRKITGTLQYKIPTTNLTNQERGMEQHHKMMFDWRSEYYEYCVGGKTGYTRQALNTLVTFATKDDVNLVAVVLRAHGKGKTFIDTRAMLDYAFENFEKVPVKKDMIEGAEIESVEKAAYVMLPKGVAYKDLTYTIEEPTEVGNFEGTVTYKYGDTVVGKVAIKITEARHNKIHNIKETKPAKKERKGGSVVGVLAKVVLIILFVAIALLLLLMFYGMYRRKQRRRRRAELRRQRREMEYRRHLQRMDIDDEYDE